MKLYCTVFFFLHYNQVYMLASSHDGLSAAIGPRRASRKPPEPLPEASETLPEAFEALPEALEALPEALEALLEALEVIPQAFGALPEALRSP